MLSRALATGALVWGLAVSTVVAQSTQPSNVGKRFPSEKREMKDKVTGVTITFLTSGPGNDDKFYQTHPQWTSDGKYILFRSNRNAPPAPPAPAVTEAPAARGPATAPAEGARAGGRRGGRGGGGGGGLTQTFAVNEQTGEIIQLTDDSVGRGETSCLARTKNLFYFYRGGNQLIELNLDPLFKDSEAKAIKPAAAYERVVATLPEGMRDAGGFTVNADDTRIFAGVRTGEGTKSAVLNIDIKTGKVTKIVEMDFQVGHTQASPFDPNELLYCNETGGDAPQRMWYVKADGTGNAPFYKESPEEWVTHEVWADKDNVIYNLMGHQPALRNKPTGIAITNVRTGRTQLFGQVEGSGFWHSMATPDMKWIVGDNFAMDMWLINVATGQRIPLLTAQAMGSMSPHSHHNISSDGKRLLFNSGMLGSSDLAVVQLPAEVVAK